METGLFLFSFIEYEISIVIVFNDDRMVSESKLFRTERVFILKFIEFRFSTENYSLLTVDLCIGMCNTVG